MAVVIETTLGDITVDLFVEERPRACLNFIKLCKLKYYNFNLFHTIERDFIAQTGDPSGAGDGGESVWGVVEGLHKRFFESESLPKIKHTLPGLLSLVSVGKFMVGSQFFFTLGSDLTSLDGIHCVIGEVVEGREVLRQLNEAIVDENFRPYQDIRVTHTVILDDPFSDPRGFQIPSRSPSLCAERLQNGRIGADEDIDDTEGKTMEEIQEMLAEREAKARATILEIVGDLPDADIAPPENVLFVCKLNPVTTDDDLEIIFSRFGKVKSCEVIRDKVSGDSLQYAFVEFEEQKSCEAAYFKMDNVLIDDRRIHVDFSQSVSKVQWRGKGRGVVHADEKDRKLDFNNLRDNKGRGENARRRRDQSRSPIRKHENSERGGRGDDRRRNIDDTRRSPIDRFNPGSRRPPDQYHTDERRYNNRPRPSSRERNSGRRRSPLDRKRRSSPNGKRHHSERQRSPGDYRQRSSPRNENRPSSNQRRNSPLNENSSLERKRYSDIRAGSNTFRNPRPDSRYDRSDSPSSSRREKRDQSKTSAARPDRPHKSDINPSESDGHSKRKASSAKTSKKELKSRSKKKKKPLTSSSSSSSESEADSSSSSSSTSSSSSEEEKRKKSKKSKTREQKAKKRPKKESKRKGSSSRD